MNSELLSRGQALVRERTVTIVLAEVLIGWFLIQRLVAGVTGDVELYRWLFTFESLYEPTPGWVLSTFSHGLNRPFSHLLPNVAILLVFGGAAEKHLRRTDYLIFFIGVGVLSSIIQVSIEPSSAPTAGASGAVYGLMFYWMYHVLRNHLDEVRAESKESTIGILKLTFATLGLVLAGALVVAEAAGLLTAGDSAVFSHASGALLGVVFAHVQSDLSRQGCAERS